MCLLLPRQLIKVWWVFFLFCGSLFCCFVFFFFSKVSGSHSAIHLSLNHAVNIFWLEKQTHQNHWSYCEKRHLLCTGVVFLSKLHFCVAINNSTTGFRISGDSEKWGFTPCLLKCKFHSRLLWFGRRFWEELLDIQKMQQNMTWEETGRAYKYIYV